MSPLSLLTSPRGQAALSYLPSLYETSRVMQTILQGQGVELDALRQAIDETLNQFFARTATWGLDLWEEELGLTPAPDQPDSERRDRIVSRIRGTGTCTISVVKQVAEAYDQGAVEVTEQPALYQVTVAFVDTRGVPPNIDDLKAAVEAVIPAHLQVAYQFLYTTWTEFDSFALTWDQVKALGITWDQLKTYHP
jgi:hypothetical protein